MKAKNINIDLQPAQGLVKFVMPSIKLGAGNYKCNECNPGMQKKTFSQKQFNQDVLKFRDL